MKQFLAILLTLLPSWCGAQKLLVQARVDSMIAKIESMQDDSSKVWAMSSLCGEYADFNPVQGLVWAERMRSLSEKIGWRTGVGMAYKQLAVNHSNLGQYLKAQEYFTKAIDVWNELGRLDNVALTTSKLADLYGDAGYFQEALKYGRKALDLANRSGNYRAILVANGDLGEIYAGLELPDSSLPHLQRALQIATRLDDYENVGVSLAMIANVYHQLEMHAMALAYYQKALETAERTSDLSLKASSQGGIGREYLHIALNGPTNSPNNQSRSATLARSVKYLKTAISESRQINHPEAIPGYYRTLSEALAAQNNYEGAFAALAEYVAGHDSIWNESNTAAITQVEMAYQFSKRADSLKIEDEKRAAFAAAALSREKTKRNASYIVTGVLGFAVLGAGAALRTIRREKKRSEALLLNILPAEVAEELKVKGVAQARQFDAVSVLFTDFVNFTGVAEKLTPQALVRELNDCFTAFDAIIERNGLEKIKTIGDAYMAASGLPTTDSQHAQKCIQAALEIRDFISESRKKGQPFEIRIGVNSGPVVAGIVGVKKFAYDIWGDTVNTAARMEQHGERGQINISESTYTLVKEAYACQYRGKIAAKNKGEIEMYFVEKSVSSLR